MVKTKSRYLDSNIEGKQKRLLPYVGGVGATRQACEDVKISDHAGFDMR